MFGLYELAFIVATGGRKEDFLSFPSFPISQSVRRRKIEMGRGKRSE